VDVRVIVIAVVGVDGDGDGDGDGDEQRRGVRKPGNDNNPCVIASTVSTYVEQRRRGLKTAADEAIMSLDERTEASDPLASSLMSSSGSRSGRRSRSG